MANLEEITLKEAATMTGYHPDYLGALIREGKLSGRKVGRTWVTTREAVRLYACEDTGWKITWMSVLLTALVAFVLTMCIVFIVNIASVNNPAAEPVEDVLEASEDVGVSL